MRFVIALVLLLLAAPIARAEEVRPEERVKPSVAQTEQKKPAPRDLELSEVKVPAVSESKAEDAAVQDMPRRGSFWWIVGVIVVAAIIVAVVL